MADESSAIASVVRWKIVAAAAGILAAQTVISVLIARQGSFFSDELVFFTVSRDEKFGLAYLRRSVFGHLTPGYLLLIRVYDRLFGVTYWPAVVVMVCALLLASVGFLRFVIEISGRTRTTLVVFGMFALSPVMIISVTWWGVMTTVFAGFAFGISACGCFLRWERTRRPWHLVGMAISYALSLCFWEKGLLIPLYLACFVVARELCRGRRLRTLLSLWPAAAVLGVLALGEAIVYLQGPYLDQAGPPPALGDLMLFLVKSIGLALGPAAFGYRRGSLAVSWAVIAILAGALIVAVVVWTVRTTRRAWWAWAFVLATLLGNQIVLGRGRVRIFGTNIGYDFRYQFDSVMLLLTGIALAVTTALAAGRAAQVGPSAPAPARLSRSRAGLGLFVAAFFAVGAVPSLVSYWDYIPGRAAGAYFRTFTSSVRRHQPGAIIDSYVLDRYIHPLFYPYTLWSVSGVLFVPELRISTSADDAFMIDPHGNVVAVSFRSVAAATAAGSGGGDCAAGIPTPATFRFDAAEVPQKTNGLYLEAVLAPDAARRTVQMLNGATPTAVDVTRRGVSTAVPGGQGDVIVLVSSALGTTVTVTADTPTCVLGLELGSFRPKG